MAQLDIKIRSRIPHSQKMLIELDAEKFERLVANFGFFSPEFLKSLKRAEKDFRAGRVSKLKSLKDLRKK